ncbi:MAG: hypothetical protein WAT51_01725 [Holophaga sp.]
MPLLDMVWKLRPALVATLSLGFLGLACSSGVPDGLAVSPSTPAVRVGESLVVASQPLEDLAAEPEWEIQELHGGGFTHSRGFSITYVAPSAAGLYHLIARAPRPDGTRMKQIVEVRVLADPLIEPASASVSPGGSRTFAARMRGLPRNTVTWSVDEPDGGTISRDGQYLAPAKPGTYHLTATSTLDPTVSATTTVRVE